MNLDPAFKDWLLSYDPKRPDPEGVEREAREKLVARLEATSFETLCAGCQDQLKALGDVVGHPFHGNQWTTGSGGPTGKSPDQTDPVTGFPREYEKIDFDPSHILWSTGRQLATPEQKQKLIAAYDQIDKILHDPEIGREVWNLLSSFTPRGLRRELEALRSKEGVGRHGMPDVIIGGKGQRAAASGDPAASGDALYQAIVRLLDLMDDPVIGPTIEAKLQELVDLAKQTRALTSVGLVVASDAPLTMIVAGKPYEIRRASEGAEVRYTMLSERAQLVAWATFVHEKITRLEFQRDTPAIRSAFLTTIRTLGGAGSGNFGHKGRPGEVGGSSSDGGAAPWKSSGGWEHTGITWKQPTDPTTGRPIPIKVATVEDAVTQVLDGKVVEVADPRTAYVVIERLAAMAADAKAKGEDAPTYDLCQVSVAGTNMFCAESLRTPEYPEGVPRLEMPQLGGHPEPGSEADKLPKKADGKVDGSQQFITYLQGLGVKTRNDEVPATSLRASQREIVGAKVGGMMAAKTYDPGKEPIFVSKDHYVVDGHHRWAAVVGRDAEDNKLGDSKMKIIEVNAPISEVLHLANAWSQKFGIKQAAGVVRQRRRMGLE